MKEIIDHLFFREGTCSTYLLDGEKKVLVDAGCIAEADIVIITHAHIDHWSFAMEIEKRCKCKFACSWRDAEHVEKFDEVTLKQFPRIVGEKSKMGSPKFGPLKISMRLKEGDRISNENFDLRVIETPGHTHGSICLYEPKQRILFSGDTWFGNEVYGRVDMPTGSEDELRKSIEKLKKLKVRLLCPGHGEPIVLGDV